MVEGLPMESLVSLSAIPWENGLEKNLLEAEFFFSASNGSFQRFLLLHSPWNLSAGEDSMGRRVHL